jgi:archaellin
MAGRKGITIIIALVLAVAITLAVALSAFIFIQKTQRSAFGQTESASTVLLTRLGTCAKIQTTPKVFADNTTEFALRNCGFREIDLTNENINVIIKTSGGESCTFAINSTNCLGCGAELGIGSFAAVRLNNSEIPCGDETLADVYVRNRGTTADMVISDKAASFTAAQSYIIEQEVTCGVSLSSPADQTIENTDPKFFCYNYTVTNLGNLNDTIRFIDEFEELPLNFTGFYNGSGCNLSNQVSVGSGDFFNLSLLPEQQFNLSYNLTPNTFFVTDFPDDIFMLAIISATPDNCPGSQIRDKTCSCNQTTVCDPLTGGSRCQD